MNKFILIILSVCLFVGLSSTGIITAIDESWVCGVKRSCVECLRLPQCTWCAETYTCFSKSLPGREDYCKDSATQYVDQGLSFEGNAMCACISPDALAQNCYPPGVTEGAQCSDRGKCECGRCVCNPMPDPDNITKAIMGEYCEFDNFSCDGPRCNEGPYHIEQQYNKLLEDEDEII